jgi:hypothetical protein
MLKKILQEILSQEKRVVIQVVKKCGRAGGCERRRAKALCGEKAWRRMESGGRKRMQACHWHWHWHPGLASQKVLYVDPLDDLRVEGWTAVVFMNSIIE